MKKRDAEPPLQIAAESELPLVADIHFDYRLALEVAERGIDKIRINPGNIGGEENVLDAREVLFRVKYEKSENEMRMIREASKICDVMIEGMLAVLRPGLYETQVAQWGRAIAGELGVETHGFQVMVVSGESNRTIIGHAMNRRIEEGDVVMLGVAQTPLTWKIFLTTEFVNAWPAIVLQLLLVPKLVQILRKAKLFD